MIYETKKLKKSTLTISILENTIQPLYRQDRTILFNKLLYNSSKLVILMIKVLEYNSISILEFRQMSISLTSAFLSIIIITCLLLSTTINTFSNSLSRNLNLDFLLSL